MSPSSQEPLGPCQERAGFLFAHDCPRSATQHCAQCDKPICTEHGHPWNGQQLCTDCFKATRKEEAEGRPEGADAAPYLYSSYYYRGYGYYGHGYWGHDVLNDPNDFTEADGVPLRLRNKDRRDFEEDMGGS